MKRNAVYPLLIILISFSLNESIYCQEIGNRILIMLAMESQDKSDSISFEEIITDTISLEFSIHDFEIISVNMGNRSRLISKSRKEQIPYLIELSYSSEAEILTIIIDCYRVEDDFHLYSDFITSSIDLELDLSIKNAMGELVDTVENDIFKNPHLVKLVIPEEQNPEVVPVFKNFSLTAGVSPFFTTGTASKYFTFGIVPEIHGQYRLKLRFGYLGLGWFASLNYFRAEGADNTSDNFLIATGPEIRIALDLNNSLVVFFRFNGGLTLFILNKNNEGFQSTLIPVLSGGFGVNINFNEYIGIMISTNYSVYFENSVYITGFSPSIGIYLKI